MIFVFGSELRKLITMYTNTHMMKTVLVIIPKEKNTLSTKFIDWKFI